MQLDLNYPCDPTDIFLELAIVALAPPEVVGDFSQDQLDRIKNKVAATATQALYDAVREESQ